MEFEDSRTALFVEPNAYIQKYDKKAEKKKIIFQEPYECMPNYYIDNGFKKGDCDCVNKKIHSNKTDEHKHNNREPQNSKQSGLGFDIKSLLPLLSLFNKGGGADFSSIVGMLNNGEGSSQNGNASNPLNLVSNLMSNKDMMGAVLNLFKGGGLNLFNKKQKTKKEIQTTDFEIKNYTKVE